MKVALQTTLVWRFGKDKGKIYYKSIMLKFMTHLTKNYSKNLDPDRCMQMISKISVRMKKLEDCMGQNVYKPFVTDALNKGLDICKLKREEVDEEWKKVMQLNKNDTFQTNFTGCDFTSDTKQTLASVSPHIEKLYDMTTNTCPKEIPEPICEKRVLTFMHSPMLKTVVEIRTPSMSFLTLRSG